MTRKFARVIEKICCTVANRGKFELDGTVACWLAGCRFRHRRLRALTNGQSSGDAGALEAFEDSGRWDYFYGEGSWDLSDGMLKRKVLSFWDGDLKVGDTFAQRIKRLGPDEGATLVNGNWQPMLRCRQEDFDIATK